ncbi:hypothetical protein FQN57_002753 [Myotisia sp. PD_48]|nr:hypothetical protein FQN57_002753 [Myotisia sp. PD_48]
MSYLRSNTKVPALLDWSDDPTNPIGSAYIIMEHCGGVLLQEAWLDIPVEKRIKCVGAISSSILPISKLEFPAYGSLYFSDASFIEADSKHKLDSDPMYCIGLHCRGSTYWDCNVGEPRSYTFKGPNRGLWPDLFSYASALIDSGLARLPPADQPFTYQQRAPYQGTVNRHLELLKIGQAAFSELVHHPNIQSNATPTLFHPDLHKRNVFVSQDDPTIVTGIIDWQCASIEPAFYYAEEVPDFARFPSEGASELSIETLCSQAYEASLALLAPGLGATRNIDEELLRPFRYCHRTWRDGVVPFTHELVRLRGAWDRLGFKNDCPIPELSPEEMSSYKEQLDIYDGILKIRQGIVETLGVEGDVWVSVDRWEEVVKSHQRLFESMMEAQEDDKDREDMKTMWPFNHWQLQDDSIPK